MTILSYSEYQSDSAIQRKKPMPLDMDRGPRRIQAKYKDIDMLPIYLRHWVLASGILSLLVLLALVLI